jgi:hypothetical protein
MVGACDDLERNNLLNSNKKEITRIKIKIKIITAVLKNSKFY